MHDGMLSFELEVLAFTTDTLAICPHKLKNQCNYKEHLLVLYKLGARGVMVIVTGYGHGDTSSNPGPD